MKPTLTRRRPAARSASTIRHAASGVAVSGFSHSTGLPAAMHASTNGSCVNTGEATTTASTSSAAISSRPSAYMAAAPSARPQAVRVGDGHELRPGHLRRQPPRVDAAHQPRADDPDARHPGPDGDLLAERERLREHDLVAAPELARVVPAHRALVGQQAHVLQRDRDELGAVDRLAGHLAPAHAPGHPRAHQARRGGERLAVVLVDHLDQQVLVLARDLSALEVTHPRALVVLLVPHAHRIARACAAGRRAGAPPSTRPAATCRARRATAAAACRPARRPSPRG